jgi:molybdopterin/thiamine biosynthesis adenylyltransferase
MPDNEFDEEEPENLAGEERPEDARAAGLGEQGLSDAASLLPEFVRNSQMNDLRYDPKRLAETPVVVIGANVLAERTLEQMLVFGFRDVTLWSGERDDSGESHAVQMLRRLSHISPYYRGVSGPASLESRAICASFDASGFGLFESIRPRIVINTVNDSCLSDLLCHHAIYQSHHALFLDVHTIQDHPEHLYGMHLQAVGVREYVGIPGQGEYLESRDLSLFDGKAHDPLMSILCASYATALAARYVLEYEKSEIFDFEPSSFFAKPFGFTLFPFSQDPLSVGAAAEQIVYDGFFENASIYEAGLGGGSLVVDTLLRLFGVRRLVGVDRDRLERSNFNRLTPFIDEKLLGLPKSEAAARVYEAYAARPGASIRFVNDVIHDSLCIGGEEEGLDIIFGVLSGFDNKLNLVALSQRLAQRKKHLLVDVGVEPFRVDITNYQKGLTPCDHCRNLHDLAVIEYIAGHHPQCERYPTGSTIFANALGALAIIQAMKYVRPSLGLIASDGVSINLLPPEPDPNLFYHIKQAPVLPELCAQHARRSPLALRLDDYDVVDGHHQGWNIKQVSERATGRDLGFFRYIPRQQVPDE